MRNNYPISIDLEGRRCCVVGGGTVAGRKVRSLLETGALIEVVSPRASEKISAWANEGKITWKRKPFDPGDLEGAFLVIGATDQGGVNEQVFRAAREKGILVNIADDPGMCNFFLPAVVHRGAFQVAVSTGGASPLLARRVREELEERYGAHFGEIAAQVAVIRKQLPDSVTDRRKRRVFWKQFIDLEYFRNLAGEDIAACLKQRAAQCLSQLED
ncbi:MAG: bifunctional precorrin-2 dehydrogenase/sirohydrochlorin ferrochelatase [Gemmatimonadota bacterium]|nr:bifunctional precorrin-2 dehydrogenase/sirohydrochlorin ferrochelatase [Gemmatimonadota bacterium]